MATTSGPTETTTATGDAPWGTSRTLGTRLVSTYLVLAAAVGIVGVGILLGVAVAQSVGGIEGLAPFVAILALSIVVALGALPALTLRAHLGWASVVGLFLVLGLELVQSMTTGEVPAALAIGVVGPGVVAVVVHALARRAAPAGDRR